MKQNMMRSRWNALFFSAMLFLRFVCCIALGVSFVALGFGGLSFLLIPLAAYLLYPNKKKVAT